MKITYQNVMNFLLPKNEKLVPAFSKLRRLYIRKNCPYCRGALRVIAKLQRTYPEANDPAKRIEIVDIEKQIKDRDYAVTIARLMGDNGMNVPLLIYNGAAVDGFILGDERAYEMRLKVWMGVVA